MLNMGIFRSRVCAVGLMAAFVLLLAPVRDFAQGASARGGSVTGYVVADDGKTPVVNATVKIRNLNNQREYSSPTDNKGMYKIVGVEEGWYTMGVSSSRGDYNLNYGVYIKSGETAKLTVSMKAGGVLEGKGAGAGKSFFGTPAGILVIVALVAGAGIGVYELTKKSQEASPIID